MNRRTFFVIALLHFDVLTLTYAATILADGTIIEIETIEPRKPTQFDINRDRNTFTGGGRVPGGRGPGGRGPGGRGPGGRGPGGRVPGNRVPGGRAQYQTVVNGEPVIIEVIREDQLNGYGQTGQNQNYWQQMQNQNRNPIIPNQGGFIVTKEKSPYPNVEIYDVYTNGGTNNMRYPNQYKNGNLFPYPNGNPNRNENFYTYPNQNKLNGNLNSNTNEKINQNGQENINLSDNKNQQNNNIGHLDIKDDTNTEQSNGDAKYNNKTNVTGYIDKFPVILLNENEIRR